MFILLYYFLKSEIHMVVKDFSAENWVEVLKRLRISALDHSSITPCPVISLVSFILLIVLYYFRFVRIKYKPSIQSTIIMRLDILLRYLNHWCEPEGISRIM